MEEKCACGEDAIRTIVRDEVHKMGLRDDVQQVLRLLIAVITAFFVLKIVDMVT